MILIQDSVRSVIDGERGKEFNGTGIKSNFGAGIALRSIESFEWGKHCPRQWNELKAQLWPDKLKLMACKIYNIGDILLWWINIGFTSASSRKHCVMCNWASSKLETQFWISKTHAMNRNWHFSMFSVFSFWIWVFYVFLPAFCFGDNDWWRECSLPLCYLQYNTMHRSRG